MESAHTGEEVGSVILAGITITEFRRVVARHERNLISGISRTAARVLTTIAKFQNKICRFSSNIVQACNNRFCVRYVWWNRLHQGAQCENWQEKYYSIRCMFWTSTSTPSHYTTCVSSPLSTFIYVQVPEPVLIINLCQVTGSCLAVICYTVYRYLDWCHVHFIWDFYIAFIRRVIWPSKNRMDLLFNAKFDVRSTPNRHSTAFHHKHPVCQCPA